MNKAYDYRVVIKRLFVILHRAAEHDLSLNRLDDYVRNILFEYGGLNQTDRSLIRTAMHDTYRAIRSGIKDGSWQRILASRSSYDRVMRAVRKVKGEKELREKQAALTVQLKENRNVFFACSIHNKPAEDHKDYQGRIYIDRFWRTKVPGRYYRAVESYIKNHNTVTVQKIQGPPVYLTSRPYCKHYFIPVPRYTVLHSSEKKIASEYSRIYAENEYDYYKMRSQVFSKLDSISPCKEYSIMKGRK